MDHKEEFLSILAESLRSGTFIKGTLGKYRGDEPGLQSILIRLVTIKQTDHLSFRYRYATRETVANHPIEEGFAAIGDLLGRTFLSGHLFTLAHDIQIEYSRKLKSRLSRSKPTVTSLPSKSHDREKRRFIDVQNNYYLQALGVVNDVGEVRERMGDKLRQINKFIEIIAGLFESSNLTSKDRISIVDMGSGKGYLTFATYDFFNNVLGVATDIVGVEAREDLVDLCTTIARDAGFERLQFRHGFIREHDPGATDILIALHACDTATDEAIYKGVSAATSIIICAPCCHKEIRPQIVPPATLKGILGHGILLEREAECITDGLRALLLEASGYTTKVFEFISTEHTQKNTMIVGVRQDTERDTAAVRAQIDEIKKFYGIKEQHLEKLLGT